MRKEVNKFGNRTYSLEELNVIIPQLDCERSKAHKIGTSNGMTTRCVDFLRSLMGYTEVVHPVYGREFEDRLIEVYNDNPDMSAYELWTRFAKDMGVSCYQKVYEILRRRGIECNRKRDFWTPIKDRQLLYLRDEKKKTFKEIATIICKNYKCVTNHYYVIKGIRKSGKSVKDAA